MRTHTRTYDDCATGHNHEGKTAEVHLASNAVAQVCEAGNDPNTFLIRVWPPNGTHEYGGNNADAISLTIKFDNEGGYILEHLNFFRPWKDIVK